MKDNIKPNQCPMCRTVFKELKQGEVLCSYCLSKLYFKDSYAIITRAHPDAILYSDLAEERYEI